MRLICIEWNDACYNSGYYDKTTPKKYEQVRTKTVGIEVKSDSKEIIVAMDSWPSDEGKTEYRHISTIPKKMIKRVIILKDFSR